jgi:hypothetical protein
VGSLAIAIGMVWLGVAMAKPQLAVVVTGEPVILGAPFWVDVATVSDGAGVETPILSVTGGAAAAPVEVRPGHWRSRVVPSGEGDIRLSARWEGLSESVTVSPAGIAASRIDGPDSVDGFVGRLVEFSVEDAAGETLRPQDLRLSVSEGGADIRCDGGTTCVVAWSPGVSPYPRALPLFLHDTRHPTARPLIIAVKLSARPTIPVQTEAGAKVLLEIGPRSYGPAVADQTGKVSFDVVVRPGDRAAVVTLEDRLGNRQKSKILLGGSRGLVMGISHQGSIIEGGLLPWVEVAVLGPRGEPAGKHRPRCEGLAAPQMFSVAPGVWAGHVLNLGDGDQRILCSLQGAEDVATRVMVERSRAVRLVLHSYPSELSADIPLAELQAYLVNGLGERLLPSGVQLHAELGTIQRDSPGAEPLIRARYDGSRAIAGGQDILAATWRRPLGEGGIWDLAVQGAAPGDGAKVLIDARAVDQGGRPLEGVRVVLSHGHERRALKTDSGGWVTGTFPWAGTRSIGVVRAEADQLVRNSTVIRGDKATAAAGAPDLVTELRLPIRAGRVHGVVINTQPRVLNNDGMVGQIEVRLEDRGGNLISGPEVEITASLGSVGPVQQRGSGVAVATFAPPVGMDPGSIRLTASTEDGRFSASTDVEIVRRVVRWSLGASAGAMAGARGLVSFRSGVSLERVTPAPFLYGRVDLMHHRLHTEGIDPVTGDAVSMAMDVLPIGVGLIARRGQRRFPFWAGGQLVLAPYHLNARFGGALASQGWGWMLPGAAVVTGVGMHLWGGEVFTELQYLFLAAPAHVTGWSGPVGGVVAGLGYKLLY